MKCVYGGRLNTVVGLTLLALVGTPAFGQETDESRLRSDPTYQPPRGNTEEQWREDKVGYPAMPQPSGLVSIDIPGSSVEYALDRKSLSVGGDEVTRYTIAVASAGARNVLYEALRCSTREFRTIGFASSSGDWRPLNRSRWQRIRPSDFRWVLWNEVLCNESGNWRTVQEVYDAVRAREMGPTETRS